MVQGQRAWWMTPAGAWLKSSASRWGWSVRNRMPKIRWWTIDLWTSMDYGGSNECYVMYLPAWSHCFLFSASLKIFWRCRKFCVIFCSVLEVPGFVESVLQSSHAAEHGFDIRDAALMVTWWANIGPIELLCVGSWWRKSTPSRRSAPWSNWSSIRRVPYWRRLALLRVWGVGDNGFQTPQVHCLKWRKGQNLT